MGEKETGRECKRKEAKGMRLNQTMSEIYSAYDSRNCCQENFMNFDKARVCVWVSVCLRLCVWLHVCVCFCLLARASKITIISGANTLTHIERLWQKSDWKLRQDTKRHRKLFSVVSKLEYTFGIVSKRVENSLLMSFNRYYICTCSE